MGYELLQRQHGLTAQQCLLKTGQQSCHCDACMSGQYMHPKESLLSKADQATFQCSLQNSNSPLQLFVDVAREGGYYYKG